VRGVPDQLGAEGLWPTWRYWAGVLLALPALVTAAACGLLLTRSQIPDPAFVAVGTIGLAAAIALILRERHVRTMTGGQKVTWTIIGLVLAFAVWFVAIAVLLAAWTAIECPNSGCFGP
jgi:hypothetical protein